MRCRACNSQLTQEEDMLYEGLCEECFDISNSAFLTELAEAADQEND